MPNRRPLVSLGVVAGLGLLAIAFAAPAPPTPTPLAVRLSRHVKFDGVVDARATLGDVLEQLNRQFDLPFDVNDRAFKAENTEDVLKTEVGAIPARKSVRVDALLRRALQKVNVGTGATFSLRDDHVEITTRAAQLAEIWGNDYKGPQLPLVQATFAKVPLEDALRDLAEQTDFTVLLDNRAAEQGHSPVSGKLRNVPLDTAVRFLADMADLRPVHHDNVLYVTTRENAAAMEARLDRERKPNPTEDENAPNHRKGAGPGAPADKGAGAGM